LLSTFNTAAQGFKTVVQKNIVLEANQIRAVNLTLELGTTTTEVTITAAPPAIETSEARVSTQIGETRVKNLPLQGRNFFSLVVLTAGVTGLPSGAGGGQAYAQANADIYNNEFGVTRTPSTAQNRTATWSILAASTPAGAAASPTRRPTRFLQELRVSANNFGRIRAWFFAPGQRGHQVGLERLPRNQAPTPTTL
jgi:hypothetical protein